mmetsp:Transcript_19790/g.24129  ORF Transcript_19790/g.24129 Transcript_19790/m.24129 type:complete len:131 (-) Transcript_19790:80-472(-)
MENLISPFLVRVFVSENRHNRAEAYKEDRNRVPECQEFHVHVWLTTTLSDIRDMIVEQIFSAPQNNVNIHTRGRTRSKSKSNLVSTRSLPVHIQQFSQMSFNLVFTNSDAKTIMKHLAAVEIFGKEKGTK